MKNIKSASCIVLALVLTSFSISIRAQNISIPDPGLDAAIRAALQKPTGPLSQQDLLNLTNLDASGRNIRSAQGLDGARNLLVLSLFNNDLTNFTLSSGTSNLISLDLSDNQISDVTLPASLPKLSALFLEKNQLTNFALPAGLTNLNQLDLGGNELTSFQLPAGLVNLSSLSLDGNQLTNFLLPAGLTNLNQLDLSFNELTNFTLPAGLVNLTNLALTLNELTSFTLPSDVTKLTTLALDLNPLATFVLPDPLAATNLSETVNALRNQGVLVFTFPLLAQLTTASLDGLGEFQFVLVGPPGIYTVLASADFITWSNIDVLTNQVGFARFNDTSPLSPAKFYRTTLQGAPTNMVFIPPNTFTLGSPTNEVGRSTDESPQTTVTLSRGFWISKFLVTQGDFLNVTGSNPSGFPGDLNRPVERVTWLDATNYCALLTQQDLAVGRISPGSHYRLPTEAEWECAARAGTSTRLYYGDDPGAAALRDHAWYAAIGGAGTHPVGQKPPNPWGLFDMEGNVWEWCQDWYGPYPGGAETDPQGPASNAAGVKVIRGGGWDAFDSDCRSARRSTEAVSPFIRDEIIGFRVVLVTDQ